MVCMTKNDFVWSVVGIIIVVLFFGWLGALAALVIAATMNEKEVEVLDEGKDADTNTEHYRLQRDGLLPSEKSTGNTEEYSDRKDGLIKDDNA